MNKILSQITGTVKKYKYVALVLVIGLALLLLPLGGGEEAAEVVTEPAARESDADYAARMEARLTEMLAQIEGAGEVQVMLTLAGSGTTTYQTDLQRSSSTDENSTQTSEERKTVILSTGSAYDEAAVSAVTYPQFQGALIVCQGAGSAAVRYALLQAVSALTGLSADRITVVKMK
ncbi:MAG: stage III sporulation protein AG [Oscillospiraceae bacterium]|nr:stage III sporulation protein AG [Oscillospiraceae bacterium]